MTASVVRFDMFALLVNRLPGLIQIPEPPHDVPVIANDPGRLCFSQRLTPRPDRAFSEERALRRDPFVEAVLALLTLKLLDGAESRRPVDGVAIARNPREGGRCRERVERRRVHILVTNHMDRETRGVRPAPDVIAPAK